jgi:deoxyribose-phosphate aldolase
MINLEEKYTIAVNKETMTTKLESIANRATELKDKEIFRSIFSLIDMTSLDVSDTNEKILSIVTKVNKIPAKFSELPNVAAICIYPAFVSLVRNNLTAENVNIASVGASFPSSQTFLDIKLKEVEKIIEEGADEVDIVMSVGKFLEKKYEEVFNEIKRIKSIMGDKHLKVILETGVLKDPDLIRKASLLSLEAGADFIKTSTGKTEVGATPEAMYVMCEAIRDYHKETGRQAGIKPAGGISDASTAINYYLIVYDILGPDWMNSSLFRIGASRLANNLLGEKYF